MARFIVIKSIARKYGYTIQDTNNPPASWIIGPRATFSWYKYKRDAIKRCQQHNDSNKEHR